jgi:hypothetical protein
LFSTKRYPGKIKKRLRVDVAGYPRSKEASEFPVVERLLGLPVNAGVNA